MKEVELNKKKFFKGLKKNHTFKDTKCPKGMLRDCKFFLHKLEEGFSMNCRENGDGDLHFTLLNKEGNQEAFFDCRNWR